MWRAWRQALRWSSRLALLHSGRLSARWLPRRRFPVLQVPSQHRLRAGQPPRQTRSAVPIGRDAASASSRGLHSHERHRHHRHLPRRLHPLYRIRLRPARRRGRLSLVDADRDRCDAGRPVLGLGRRRRRVAASCPQDAVYRNLCLHHRQFRASGDRPVRELRGPGPQGFGKRNGDRRFHAAGRCRRDRSRCRRPFARCNCRPVGTGRALHQFCPDCDPADRLADCRARLFRARDPGLRDHHRVQAGHAGRLCPAAVRLLRPHRLHGRACARAHHFFGDQDPRASRHHRDRYDALQPVLPPPAWAKIRPSNR